jgi:hypothetical protein
MNNVLWGELASMCSSLCLQVLVCQWQFIIILYNSNTLFYKVLGKVFWYHDVTAQGPSLSLGLCPQGSKKKKDITCISEYNKFRGCKYPDYPNGCCRKLADLHLAIEVNWLYTLFIAVFPYGLDAQADFACSNRLITIVTVGNEAVPGRKATGVKKYTAKDNSCIN